MVQWQNGTLQPLWKNNEGIINAYTRHKIDLVNPTPEMISIEDIAHALSNICRFGGHTGEFYSVAQHSILVWALCGNEYTPEIVTRKKIALLHDAPEAYLGDVVKPLKNALGETYSLLELKMQDAICRKFSIALVDNWDPQLKELDKQACQLEFDYFFMDNRKALDRYFNTFENTCWTPAQAKEMYLSIFKETFE